MAERVRQGDRRALARRSPSREHAVDHARLGQSTLEALVPASGGAQRVGITGPPGVGKSTFIEALGLALIEAGHRVAVLAVDPRGVAQATRIPGGRAPGPSMERLARREEAFILRGRPRAARSGRGRTREAMLVCEAAGFDVVLVETVGIGQSEVTVAAMVDFFLVLVQPGAGDES